MRRLTRWSPPTAVLVIVLAACTGSGTELTSPTAGSTPETPASPPVEIGTAFMEALNSHDVDAMLALTASEEVLASTADDGTIEWFRSQMEQREVLGWTYDFTCNAQSEKVVVCPAAFTNHITEVFDIEPYEGSEVILTIEDGLVTDFVLNEDTDAWQSEGGFGAFYQWMLDNYPDEEHTENMYYNYGDEANLDFLKQYIPLLLASGAAAEDVTEKYPPMWAQQAHGLTKNAEGQHTIICPPDGVARTVWGTGTYTADSSICTAAVHAGLIGFDNGGVVVIEMRPGEGAYEGTTANGVTTHGWGAYVASFVFVD